MLRSVVPSLLVLVAFTQVKWAEPTSAAETKAEETKSEKQANSQGVKQTTDKRSSVGKRIEIFSARDYRGKETKSGRLRRQQVGRRRLRRNRVSAGQALWPAPGGAGRRVRAPRRRLPGHRLQPAGLDHRDHQLRPGSRHQVPGAQGRRQRDRRSVRRDAHARDVRARREARRFATGAASTTSTAWATSSYASRRSTSGTWPPRSTELLAGKEVSEPATEAVGCFIGRVRPAKGDSPVTYSNQVARILQKHCVECHRPGEIAPFALTDYDEVVGWAEMIDEVVREQRMPPWHADPKYGHFSNDRSLSREGQGDAVHLDSQRRPAGRLQPICPRRSNIPKAGKSASRSRSST